MEVAMTKGEGPFTVTATVTETRESRGGLWYVTGLDENGDTIVWLPVFGGKAIKVGDVLDVIGHTIYAYSGEVGPWGPAPINRVDKRDIRKGD
jgi:hypothetical protein